MPPPLGTDALDTLLVRLEDDIMAAPDRELLDVEAHRRVGDQAREAMTKALAARWPQPRRLGGRPRAPAAGRELVQRLLVASARARAVAGTRTAEGLSDAQVAVILKRFVDAGLSPPDEVEGGLS